jgi:tetratricopeptide (TPR) repeat protein
MGAFAMPTVYNGIGTWYYGKDHLHSRKGTCSLCNRVCTLESYDTTLFFVVIFVPVIPLAKKRILEKCSACQRHRVMPLKQWEQAKAKDSAEVLKKLENNPNDRDAILHALSMATGYQDEPLFNQVAESLAADRKDDRAIQITLANGYVYFVRWPEAEQAYRTALALEDTEDVRESLAWTLLKQGRPEEALPFLGHILEKKKQESAGMVYHLIAGYQAEGRHQEALAIIDERDAAFPQLAGIKEYVAQRKTSERYKDTGKKIASPRLTDDKGAGYREGGWAARIPRLIPLILLGGLLIAYFGSAWWIGQNRKVYLVNGTDKPYKVAINGYEHLLSARSATLVRIPEGEVIVEFRDDKAGIEPVKCELESNFWSRPFTSPTNVINPDQQAVIAEEQTIYSNNPQEANPPPTWHMGEKFIKFSSVDYPFEPFPQTLNAKSGQTITKKRVGLIQLPSHEERLLYLQMSADKPHQVEFAKHVLQWDPSQTVYLHWLASIADPDDALQIIEPKLEARPLLIEWHRAYQSLMEKTHPEVNLRERYARIAGELKGNADALYLQGRVQDSDERDKLYRQAANANPPCYFAHVGMGYIEMSEGRFPEAVQHLEVAEKNLPANALVHESYLESLLAAKEYKRLMAELDKQRSGETFSTLNQLQKMRAAAIKGDLAQAQVTLQQMVNMHSPTDAMGRLNTQATLEMLLAPCRDDEAGYLKVAAEHPEKATFESHLLQGKLTQAANAPDKALNSQLTHAALMYLFADRGGDKKLSQESWQNMIAELSKGDKDERRAAAMGQDKQFFDAELMCRFVIRPDEKRVILAAFAQKYPDKKKPLLDLVRKLDFQHDAVSLCLKKVLK